MIALRAGRALVGLSQEELASRAGVSRQMVLRIEKAEGSVTAESIEKVRSALDAAGVVFLDGTEQSGPAVALRRPAGQVRSPEANEPGEG